MPKANSHVQHTALACASCHQTTATQISTGTAFIYHANQVYDVYPSASSYFTYSAAGSGGICAMVACYGYTSATWGVPGSFSCVDCDGDGICLSDNCPTVANPGQQDADNDGIGDAFDSWSYLAGGIYHTLARRVDGMLWAWGDNWQGQLGDGTTLSKSFPVQVNGDTSWATAAGGEHHTLALKADGSLWAWGNNSQGRLGNGTYDPSYVPIRIGSDTDWAKVETGHYHSLGLKTDGSLWSWGGQFRWPARHRDHGQRAFAGPGWHGHGLGGGSGRHGPQHGAQSRRHALGIGTQLDRRTR